MEPFASAQAYRISDLVFAHRWRRNIQPYARGAIVCKRHSLLLWLMVVFTVGDQRWAADHHD